MLVLAVLVGVLGIGTAKVRGVAGTALDYYNQNMAADFTARETAAQTILGIAGQELGEDDAKVQAAAGALAESQAAATRRKSIRRAPSWRRRWALCTMHCLRPRGTRRKSAAQLAWSEFVSRTDILSHSMEEYNTLCPGRTGYNKGLSGLASGKVGRGGRPGHGLKRCTKQERGAK